MVTHNGQRYLRRQCDSIFRQNVLPAVLIVVDDASSDATRPIIQEVARTAPIPVELIVTDRSDLPSARSRVAANVVAGIQASGGYDVTILADQDDEWLVDRVASQRAILGGSPGALLVAGDGILIDTDGCPLGDRLRDRFPIPSDWETLDPAGRVRAALRHPFVTGAAAALSAELVRLMSPVPRGWLHDRWATLAAVARNGLVLQDEPVIRYRIHDGQLLGMREARSGAGRRRWQQVLERGTGPLQAAGRVSDVIRRIRPLATDPAIRSELSLGGVLRAAMARA
jgi:glycosyltransferase involved in cell wall biosynthesis